MRRNNDGDRFPMRREGQDDPGMRGLRRQSDWISPSEFFNASPWQLMRRVQEDLDRSFSEFFGGGWSPRSLMAGMGMPSMEWTEQFGAQQWQPSMDVSEDDREWRIELDLPGVKKDDIDVQVHQHMLTLRAEMREERDEDEQERRYHRRERRYGYFERSFPLPDTVDQENIRCEFRDGVLKVHLPKTEQREQRGRRIPVGEGRGEGRPQSGESGESGGRREQRREPQREAHEEREEHEPAMAGAKGGEKNQPGETSGNSGDKQGAQSKARKKSGAGK